MLELYKNIKLRRKELGLTQEELARRTGYTNKSSIATIESGKVDIPQSKILEFARALEISPADLFGWTDEPLIPDEATDNIPDELIKAYQNGNYLKKYTEMPQEYRDIVNRTIENVYEAWKITKE